MDSVVTQVLQEYETRITREHQIADSLTGEDFERRKNEFLLPIGAAAGRFLNILVKSAKSRCVLEVGTSYGYSTVWLAEAARHTGAKVVTLELAAAKADYARAQLRRAGLGDYVDFRVGDAIASIAALAEPVDFVLIDLWKDLYVPTLLALYPRLADGALVVADNILEPASTRAAAALYVAAVKRMPGMDTITVPIGNGIELSRLTRQ